MAGADVVVIGGGVIGCACAHALAAAGASVTLVERANLAEGASGRNHGLLLTPLDSLLVPMFQRSLELYRELAGDAPVPFSMDPDPIGFLIVASDEASELETGRAEAEAAAAGGVRVETLDGAAIATVEPALSRDLTRGWLLEDGRRLDPAALTVSLALDAARRGADVRRHLPVRGFVRRGQAVRGILTDEGPIEADTVVLAAGHWSPTLVRPLAIELPVAGIRGWLVHLRPTAPAVGRLVSRAGWHRLPGQDSIPPARASDLADRFSSPDVGVLLQPNRDGTLLVGGSRERVFSGHPDDPAVSQQLLREAIHLAPQLGEADTLGSWWGVRPMSPDGRPIIGWIADGLIVAAGHGSHGVILGGGTGELVASTALGEPPPFDPDPLSPARFGN